MKYIESLIKSKTAFKINRVNYIWKRDEGRSKVKYKKNEKGMLQSWTENRQKTDVRHNERLEFEVSTRALVRGIAWKRRATQQKDWTGQKNRIKFLIRE